MESGEKEKKEGDSKSKKSSESGDLMGPMEGPWIGSPKPAFSNLVFPQRAIKFPQNMVS